MANVFEYLTKINRRVWFGLLLILIIGGYFYPVVIPLTIDPHTTDYYNKIQEIKPDEIILIYFGSGPEVKQTMWSAYRLTLWQIFGTGAKIIWITTMPQASAVRDLLLSDPLIQDVMKSKNYQTGVNFVDAGFVYMESGLVNFVRDFQGFTQNKYKDTFFGTLKDMGSVNRMFWYGGDPDSYKWLAQYVSLVYKNCKIYTVSESGTYPTHLTYLQAGNFYACMQGVTGSAEYEIITNHIGPAIAQIGIVSITHVLFLVAILVSNLGYFGWERKQQTKKK